VQRLKPLKLSCHLRLVINFCSGQICNFTGMAFAPGMTPTGFFDVLA